VTLSIGSLKCNTVAQTFVVIESLVASSISRSTTYFPLCCFSYNVVRNFDLVHGKIKRPPPLCPLLRINALLTPFTLRQAINLSILSSPQSQVVALFW
jgi:hypothetical protein